MATKKIRMDSKILLSDKALERISDVLKSPQTDKQKQAVIQAKGVYAFYQAKWLKK